MTDHGSLTEGGVGAEYVTTRKGMWGVKNGADTTGFSGHEEVITIAQPAHRPYGGWFDDVVDILGELLAAEGLRPDDVIEKLLPSTGNLLFSSSESIW